MNLFTSICTLFVSKLCYVHLLLHLNGEFSYFAFMFSLHVFLALLELCNLGVFVC